MKPSSHRLSLCVLFFVLALNSELRSQGTTSIPEDHLKPEEFTAIMKEAWSFLKEETDSLAAIVGSKNEFETTAEFEKRTVEARQQYLSKINKYIKDKKFDTRVMGVLFKAQLGEYNADRQEYAVKSSTLLEAPYNIPSIVTEIVSNPYVALSDSIKKGYRTSSIYLKFSPHLRWQVPRDTARVAKNDESQLYFRVRFKIDLSQTGARKGARFLIVPQRIQLVNMRTHSVYWEQVLR